MVAGQTKWHQRHDNTHPPLVANKQFHQHRIIVGLALLAVSVQISAVIAIHVRRFTFVSSPQNLLFAPHTISLICYAQVCAGRREKITSPCRQDIQLVAPPMQIDSYRSMMFSSAAPFPSEWNQFQRFQWLALRDVKQRARAVKTTAERIAEWHIEHAA